MGFDTADKILGAKSSEGLEEKAASGGVRGRLDWERLGSDVVKLNRSVRAHHGHWTVKQELTLMTSWVPEHVAAVGAGEADPRAARKLAKAVRVCAYIVLVVCVNLKDVLRSSTEVKIETMLWLVQISKGKMRKALFILDEQFRVPW